MSSEQSKTFSFVDETATELNMDHINDAVRYMLQDGGKPNFIMISTPTLDKLYPTLLESRWIQEGYEDSLIEEYDEKRE